MQIWLDTVQKNVIVKAKHLGCLSGVTTNPHLIVQENRPFETILKEILDCQEGPVTAQVVAKTCEEMVDQGQLLFEFSNRLIVKIPCTQEGLKAIHCLSQKKIPTMATIVFNTRQAILAAHAGANYIAPYLSRIEEAGNPVWVLLKEMQNYFLDYKFPIKILGASLRNVEEVIKCAHIGIYGVTINPQVFEKLIQENVQTSEKEKFFSNEWHQGPNAHQFLGKHHE